MRTWRRSTSYDRCASCGARQGQTPTRRRPNVERCSVPVLEVTFTDTTAKKINCAPCARSIFTERTRNEGGAVVMVREEVPPTECPSVGVTLRPPAPLLPMDELHRPAHQGVVTLEELSRRAIGRSRAIAAKARQTRQAELSAVAEEELPAEVLDSALYRPPGVRQYLEDREPGSDDE